MSNKVKLYRPFSPPIGQFTLSSNFVDDLNAYVESVSKNSNLKKSLDHGKNLAGEVTQEILVTEEFLAKGLLEFLGKAVANYIHAYNGKKIKNFRLLSSWIVRQFKNEYNPIHWHGGHISGVAYLKIPNSFGESFQKTKRDNANGKIVFTHGSRQFMSRSTISFTPVVGDLFIFPNYLMHSVYPFYSDGERRSVSFNAYVDKDIYNDYGED